MSGVIRVRTDRGPGKVLGELPGPPEGTVVLVKLDRGPLVFRALALCEVLGY